MGSIDRNNNISSFSSVGPRTVDLFAPGGFNKYFPDSEDILTTFKNNDYGFAVGTSMAAPYVTGVAVLVKSLHPYMTATELKIALRIQVAPWGRFSYGEQLLAGDQRKIRVQFVSSL